MQSNLTLTRFAIASRSAGSINKASLYSSRPISVCNLSGSFSTDPSSSLLRTWVIGSAASVACFSVGGLPIFSD
jgi:hypothetical protein